VLVDRDENGNIVTKLFAGQQDSDSMLTILGYTGNNSAAKELEEQKATALDLEAQTELAHS